MNQFSNEQTDYLENTTNCQLYNLSNHTCTTNQMQVPNVPPFFKHVALAHFNVRDLSANTRFQDLKNDVGSFPFQLDFIGISESWCSPYTEGLFEIPDYQRLSLSRRFSRGGGVILYVNKWCHIKKQHMYANESATIQVIAWQARLPMIDKDVVVMTLYNSDGNLSNLKEALDDCLCAFPRHLFVSLRCWRF
jgi:hypothetical protein